MGEIPQRVAIRDRDHAGDLEKLGTRDAPRS
jgi:hypothetical protein